MADRINVEVAWASLERQEVVQLTLPTGTTLGEAVRVSGLAAKYPQIDVANGKFGIYGKLAKPDTELRERDRVEIYRPLIADPKEVRKQRAAAGKQMKKGGGDAADASSATKETATAQGSGGEHH